MLVLGIESSCDETGVAILQFDQQGRATVVGEVLSSQVELHEKYGGVVPELASREHMKSLPFLCESVQQQTGVALSQLSAIGVTCGPGLKGCLLIGVTYAQGVSLTSGVPVLGVNHIEGHILSGELHYPELQAPYLALVVSGGHTELVLVEGLGRYTILCRTLDDAAGEAFDKSGNLMGLPYPGGARLAKLADTVTSSRFKLPRVAREFDAFSFSGLKTAVLLQIRKNKDLLDVDLDARAEMAWAIQDAIVDPLVHKTSREVAERKLPLVVCGGVSANATLNRRLEERCAKVYVPPARHCVDNGAMIAYVAGRSLIAGRALPSPIEIRSRWPVEELA